PDESGVEYGLGKVCVFGQETITGVDRTCPGLACRFENFRHVEVGVRRGHTGQADSIVSFGDKWCICIGIRMDCDGRQAAESGGFDDSAGDLTAVGDEYWTDVLGL